MSRNQLDAFSFFPSCCPIRSFDLLGPLCHMFFCGSRLHCITWLGMVFNTELMSIVLPAGDRDFDFHLESYSCIFSSMKLNKLDLAIAISIGKPTKWFVFAMSSVLQLLWCHCWWIFAENKIMDFSILTNCPNKVHKFFRISFIASSACSLTSPKSIVSSAKNTWERLISPHTIEISFHLHSLTLFFVIGVSISRQMMNRYREMGSPYLIPLEGSNLCSLPPLKSTLISDVDMHCMLVLVSLSGKPDVCIACSRKLHSTLS